VILAKNNFISATFDFYLIKNKTFIFFSNFILRQYFERNLEIGFPFKILPFSNNFVFLFVYNGFEALELYIPSFFCSTTEKQTLYKSSWRKSFCRKWKKQMFCILSYFLEEKI